MPVSPHSSRLFAVTLIAASALAFSAGAYASAAVMAPRDPAASPSTPPSQEPSSEPSAQPSTEPSGEPLPARCLEPSVVPAVFVHGVLATEITIVVVDATGLELRAWIDSTNANQKNRFDTSCTPATFKSLQVQYADNLDPLQTPSMRFKFTPKVGANCSATVAVLDKDGKVTAEYSSGLPTSIVKIKDGEVHLIGKGPDRYRITVTCTR